MVRICKETGNVIIEIEKKENYFNPAEEIGLRREALFDMIVQHNNKVFHRNGEFYGIIELLKRYRTNH